MIKIKYDHKHKTLNSSVKLITSDSDIDEEFNPCIKALYRNKK